MSFRAESKNLNFPEALHICINQNLPRFSTWRDCFVWDTTKVTPHFSQGELKNHLSLYIFFAFAGEFREDISEFLIGKIIDANHASGIGFCDTHFCAKYF